MSVFQVKIGMRISDMPGARMLMIVTRKLNAPASEATPSTCRPSIQKSIRWLGENWRVGERRVAEPAAVRQRRPRSSSALMKIPPNRNVQ